MEIGLFNSKETFDKVIDEIRRLPLELQLGEAADRFDQAINELQEVYCGEECKTETLCEKTGICRTALKEVDAWSLFYANTLSRLNDKHKKIPEEYFERYLIDVSQCLRVISSMSKETGNFINTIRQNMNNRMNQVKSLLPQKSDYIDY